MKTLRLSALLLTLFTVCAGPAMAKSANPPSQLDLSNWEQEESFHCYVKQGVFFQEHVFVQFRRDGSKRVLIRFLVNGELVALEDLVINERPSRVTYQLAGHDWQKSERARLLFEEDFTASRRYALGYAGASLDELERANCAK